MQLKDLQNNNRLNVPKFLFLHYHTKVFKKLHTLKDRRNLNVELKKSSDWLIVKKKKIF